MRTVVNNNILYSSDYISIVLSQENFESLRHYFFFHLWSGSNNLHCRWLLWNLTVWVIILRAPCKLDLQAHYKNEIFVSYWPVRCNKVRVNWKKKNRWQRNIRWNLWPVKENYLDLRIKKIVETKSSGQERHLWTVIGFVCASEAPNFAILWIPKAIMWKMSIYISAKLKDILYIHV